MPKGQVLRKSVTNFSEGMDTLFSDFTLSDGESPHIKNGDIIEVGAIKKRNGYQQVGTTQSDFTIGARDMGLFESGTGTQVVVANGGTKIKRFTSNAWSDLPTLPTISNADEKFAYIMYEDKLLMSSQSHYFSWDGSSAVTDLNASIATKGDLMMLDGEARQIYMSGDDGNPSTIYISDTDDETSFAGGNSATVLVYDNDGSRINGMAMLQGTRYVLKTNKIVRLDYTASTNVWVPVIVDSLYGAIGKDAWVIGDNNVFFFTGTEIRAFGFFENYTTERSVNIGWKIDPTILSDMDPDNLANAKLFYLRHEKKMLLSYISSESTTHDRILVFDFSIPTKEGTLGTPVGFWTIPMKSGVEVSQDFYFGEPTTGKLHIFDNTYNDAGTAIDFQYDTKAFHYGDPHLYKMIRYIDLIFKNLNGTVTLTITTESGDDFETSTHTFDIGSSVLTGFLNENVLNETVLNEGSLVISGAGTDNDFIISDSVGFIKKRLSVAISFQTLKISFKNDILDDSFTLLRTDFNFIENMFRRYHSADIV